MGIKFGQCHYFQSTRQTDSIRPDNDDRQLRRIRRSRRRPSARQTKSIRPDDDDLRLRRNPEKLTTTVGTANKIHSARRRQSTAPPESGEADDDRRHGKQNPFGPTTTIDSSDGLCGSVDEGHIIVFDHTQSLMWNERLWHRPYGHGGGTIMV